MSNKILFPDVTVELVGENGNVFNVIALVASALRRAGHGDAATQFANDAMNASSYEEVLYLAQTTVNVT